MSHQIALKNTTLFLFAKRFKGSSEYLWLERNLVDKDRTTYQKRNYNKKYGLDLKGMTIKKIIEENNELKYVITLEDATNSLKILTVSLMYTSSLPVNLNYRYVIKDSKEIAKNSELQPEIYVLHVDFEYEGEIEGKRIIIAGTAQNNSNIFLAIYNTRYNVTEFIYEELSTVEEKVKAIHFSEHSRNILVISERQSNFPIEPNVINTQIVVSNTSKIAVRSFSLDRRMLEWSIIVGHSSFSDIYGSSGLNGNFLIIAYYTTKTHQITSYLTEQKDLEFAVIRAETGEGILNNCGMVLSNPSGPTELLDMAVTQEHGIFLLLNVSQGDTTFILNSQTYSFSERSFALFLFELDLDSSSILPQLGLLDVEAIPNKGPINLYPPSKLLLTYPSGYEEGDAPEILLLSYLYNNNKTGLQFFSYDDRNNAVNFHNPFLTDVGCTASNCQLCLVSDKSKCLKCKNSLQNYIASQMTCVASCPSNYYLYEGKKCARCHYSCLTCNGPLRTNCLSCDATNRKFKSLLGECVCASSNPYSRYGSCTSSCTSGQAGVHTSGNCLSLCPNYRFHYVNYATKSSVKKMTPLGATGGNDLLEFLNSGSECLKLPGPPGFNSLPKEFTMSLWIYSKSGWSGTKVLLWGFNSFSLKVVSPSASGPYQASFSLHQITGGDLTVPSVANSYSLLDSTSTGAWNFLAASFRKNMTKYELLLYVTSSSSGIEAGRISGSNLGDLPTYVNQLLVGCSGTYYSSTQNVNVVQTINFNGYMRELVFQNKFQDVPSLEDGKSRVYSQYLSIYYGVLMYWRFDDIASVSGGYQIVDSSQYGLTQTITGGNPKKSTATSLPISTSKWDNFGQCTDIFEDIEFPKYSIEYKNYAQKFILYRINSYSPDFLVAMLRTGDRIKFSYMGCDSVAIVELNLIQLSNGKIQVEKNEELPDTVQGTHVDVCYFSNLLNYYIKLGQVYFPLFPQQIFPSHGTTDKTYPTYVTFTLAGGDQALGDKIALVDMEQNITAIMQPILQVDEAISSSNILSKISATTFSSVYGSAIDAGIYTVGWRPAYANFVDEEGVLLYRNLYTTWSFQSIPRARFELVTGMTNLYQNSATFKAQLLYLDLVGSGQSDGDEILFCYTGCHYMNKRGNPYTRINGKYPPVWFGEEAGVYNLIEYIQYDRLYICWRPAARAKTTAPEDDLWSSVSMYTSASEKSFIRLYSLNANKNLPEIYQTTPPMSWPILLAGETISFTISKCGTKKTKPTSYEGTYGKVTLLHKIYTNQNHSSYSTEIIWEQKFQQFADTGTSGYTVGNLLGDHETCKYSLSNVPQNKLINGHEYVLVIYTRSFKCPLTNEYLFGELEAGKAQFQFQFFYQDILITSAPQHVMSSTTEITLKGNYFGDEIITDGGFEEIRYLFGVNFTLFCGSKYVPSNYKITNLKKDNPQKITLSGLDLSSCSESLTINLTLLKLSDYSRSLVWQSYSTASALVIPFGECDSTCSTCNGTTKQDCVTCNIDSEYQYLYRGQCLSKCQSDLPLAEVVWITGTYTASYYKCVVSCEYGSYLDPNTNTCYQCNDQCGSCSSGNPMSCLTCKGTAILVTNSTFNFYNTYNETFFYNQMCMLKCPSLINEFNTSFPDLFSANDYIHQCVKDSLPQGSNPISVTIQKLIFPQKVNIKRSIKLRALISDPTNSIRSIQWAAVPDEDKTIYNFYSSDERIFDEYTTENLNTSITTLNMNAFNFKGENDEMRIFVKVLTNNSIGYDLIELFGNRPPELTDSSVAFNPASGLKTFNYINVTVNEISDSDDIYEILKFRVLLVAKSLVIPANPSTTLSTASLQLLAQLPETTKTIYSGQQLHPKNKVVNLNNIFIPPLIEGTQTITAGVNSSAIICDFFIVVEDRHFGIKKSKFTYNVSEQYTAASRSTFLTQLQKETSENLMDWDLALRVGHTFLISSPSKVSYYMASSSCTRDSQCSSHGKCLVYGGQSECVCNEGYTGLECEWVRSELKMAQNITNAVLTFLDEELLQAREADPNYQETNTDILDEIANILIGLLKNPEVGNGEKHLNIVVKLCKYLSNINNQVGGLLEKYQQINILNALDTAYIFIFFHMRKFINSAYELAENTSKSLEAEYLKIRKVLASNITALTQGLYQFTNAISMELYPGDDPFYIKLTTFEVFILAEREDSMFEKYNSQFGLQISPTTGYIKIPQTFFDNIRANIADNAEFKVCVVLWTENPYVFSDFQSGVVTNVIHLAILDSNSTEVTLSLKEPIILFLQLSNITRNYQREFVRCKKFDSSNVENKYIKIEETVDVNLLSVSDAEKHLRFPEWDSNFYTLNHLISREIRYELHEVEYPEFVDSKDLASYGNTLHLDEYQSYILCACYNTSEVAGIIERKKAREVGLSNPGFYHHFDPISYWSSSLLFYYCMSLLILFGVSYSISIIADIILLPNIEKLVEFHRVDYSDNEVETNDLQKNEDSNMNLMLTKQEGEDNDETHTKSLMTMRCDITDEDKKDGDQKSNNTNAISEMTGSHIKEYDSVISTFKEKDNLSAKLEANTHSLPKATSEDLQTGVMLRTNINPTTEDDEKNFSYINAEEIRGKDKNERQTEDIFSEVYISKREAEQFSILNIFVNANILLNLIIRSNSIFTRPTRCILLFIQIYFHLFWSTVLMSGQKIPLKNPQTHREISGVVLGNLWMPMIVPIFVTLVMFIIAGMFKLNESQVFACKSIFKYRRVRNGVIQECIVRRLIGLLFTAIAVIGMTVFIIRFSANYGWKASSECIWCSLISLGVDMILYDGLIACSLFFIYSRSRDLALWIHSWRRFKQAEIQE